MSCCHLCDTFDKMFGVDVPEAYRLLIADVLELAGASRRTSEAIARPLGQTTARWHVLSVVSEEALTVSGAARRLGLARQNVQRVVNDLLGEGLVEASDNPDHRTALLIKTTAAGGRVLAELVRASDADRGRRLQSLDLDARTLTMARTTLRAILQALHEA